MTSHLANYPNQPASNEKMLDSLQRDAFGYFQHENNPENGLVLVVDKTQPDAPASIAAVGFALAVYPVGAVPGDERTTKQGRRLIAACPTSAFSALVLLKSNAVPTLQGRWRSTLRTRFAHNGLINDPKILFWFAPHLCHTRVAADVDRSTKNRHRNGWPHRSKLLARHRAEPLRRRNCKRRLSLSILWAN